MTYVGIDPGKNGGLAFIPEGGKNGPYALPFDKDEYLTTLAAERSNGRLMAVLERVSAMPKQGVVSTFSFGENFGWIQGVLESLSIPYELVRPQQWKKMFGCPSDKNTSIEVASRLFPAIDFRASDRCRKPHDGKCEAMLMAEYARRMFR